jgi:hypothetical protein
VRSPKTPCRPSRDTAPAMSEENVEIVREMAKRFEAGDRELRTA